LKVKKSPTIILFGGSFDPIHNGHLAVAMFAGVHLNADQIIFIPARRNPHKKQAPIADDVSRLTMIHLAIMGKGCFGVSDCELTRPEPSYTIDTVEHYRRQYGPQANLFWLIGADMVAGLPYWHRVKELLTVCRLCIMYRGGMDKPDLTPLVDHFGQTAVDRLKNDMLETPLVDISSTEIRARIAAGQSVADFVPPPVLRFIEQKRLYRDRAADTSP